MARHQTMLTVEMKVAAATSRMRMAVAVRPSLLRIASQIAGCRHQATFGKNWHGKDLLFTTV